MLPPIVSSEWFAEHRDEVVVADVRWYLDGRSGREAHEAGHISGAVFVDLDAWLAAPATRADGRHPLPDPAVFAMGLGALGIGDGDAVVAYDDAGGVIAARLVWMLRSVGHDAALLDAVWMRGSPHTDATRLTPAPSRRGRGRCPRGPGPPRSWQTSTR